jgi:hypothetical protein
MKINDNHENYMHLPKVQETQEIGQSKTVERAPGVQRNPSSVDWVTLSHTFNNLQLAKTVVITPLKSARKWWKDFGWK